METPCSVISANELPPDFVRIVPITCARTMAETAVSDAMEPLWR